MTSTSPTSRVSQAFDEEVKGLLYQALASETGICVKLESSSDVTRWISRAYKVRSACWDPELDGLVLKRSPVDVDRVWIVRETALRAQVQSTNDAKDELAAQAAAHDKMNAEALDGDEEA